MWWKPQSANEERVNELLSRIEGRFIEQRQTEVVLAIGSLFGDGLLHPLILLNQNLTGLPKDPYQLGVPLRLGQTDSGLSIDMRRLLATWELPAETRVLFVTPPEPLSSSSTAHLWSGAPIRCQQTHVKSTVGAPLALQKNRGQLWGFLTVGHAAPRGLGSVVELIDKRGWFRATRYWPVGTVAISLSPSPSSGRPEYDVAVVKLSLALQLNPIRHQGIARLRSPVAQPLIGTVYGAASGVVGGAAIVGALTDLGGANGLWKNCWLVVPSGLISQGDSGAILVLRNSRQVAGIIVGGSRVLTSTTYMAQYAQDMESIDRDVLQPQGLEMM